MSTMQQVPDDHPLKQAWDQYMGTDDFANTKRWAGDPHHLQGSLWAVFMAGFNAATGRAASLHEQVNPASDDERFHGHPGAGAMGAVIEYRDLIRKQN